MSNKSGVAEQILSLPKGGGALSGLGEKFSPDLFTGTGNFTVPIAVPAGRNGLQPQLNLVYSTGSGNGIFGFGWNLSSPGITRKTSRGIPRYHDDDPTEEPDVFILSGVEDLVPVENPLPGVTRYHPRTEGLFALIDHHHSAGDDYWEVRSKDGLVSLYGTPGTRGDRDPAAIAKDDERKFSWKLTETRDPFHNRIVYAYMVDAGEEESHRWRQPLLSRIAYAEAGDDPSHFLVSVSFDYEERPEDKFSDYRAGFEIRTTRLCKAIAVETHFGQDRKVRTYELTYDDLAANGHALLTRIDVVGYDDAGQSARELPPLTFAYSVFNPLHARTRDLIPVTGSDLPPGSLGRREYELADLSGDGLPDILEMNGTVRYWRNLGSGRFDLPREMRSAPPVRLADPGVQMLDADGNGRVDLMVTAQPLAGYYTLNHNGEWDARHSFRRYPNAPSFNLEDPEVKLLDLDGDGITDALRSSTHLECYFQSPQKGWDPDRVRFVPRKRLEEFPDVGFSDARVKLGDMNGDGLQDILLVYDGNIEYWPNLGYGRWGRRIHMRNSPRFQGAEYTFGYDPRRVLIGDVDGDGLADLVYVDDGKVTLWINRSGNAWSDPIEISGTPAVTDTDAVRLVDLLGCGISGILWSADANAQDRPSMFFLDLTGGVKPYLLNEMDNHLGAVTKVEYRPSTAFYLEDRKSPKTRWKTSLPFPVQVVARVEVIDFFSKGKLTTEYRYHDGYWDGEEREFRGFGMVEQLDSETFEIYSHPGLHPEAEFARVQEHHFSPPVLTRAWFHQGPVEDDMGEWFEPDRSGEYWPGDPALLGHTETVNTFLKSRPDRPARRDALRALRGSLLRTELYALDRLMKQDRIWPEDRPYTVSEQAYALREEQPPPNVNQDRKRIFFPHPIIQRTTQWERGDDPMTSFSFTGDYDAFGQPRRQTAVAMPRRSIRCHPVTAAVVGTTPVDETHILAVHNRTRYATPDPGLDLYSRVAEVLSYELIQPPVVSEQDEDGNDIRMNAVEVLRAQYRAAQAVCLKFDALRDVDVKLIGHTLNHYDGSAIEAFKGRSDGKIGPYGVLTRSETLVFRREELDTAYAGRRPAYLGGQAALPAGAPTGFGGDLGYRLENAPPYVTGYYTDTQRRRYDFQEKGPAPYALTAWPGRGMVTAMQDPRGNTTVVQPDHYWLLPESMRDPQGLETSVQYNYRLLQPLSMTDPNGNSTHMEYSPIGLMTKQWRVSRDGLQGGTEMKPEIEFAYDLLAYIRTREAAQPEPIFVHARQRIWHASDQQGDELIESREYSDGFGRLLQKRLQAEDLAFGTSGSEIGIPGTATGQRTTNRVIVSGWQVYDNKGHVIEKYEPFFSTGWDWEFEAQNGQRVELTYDPRGRVIRTLNPDGSELRTIPGIPRDLSTPQDYAPTPWETYSYDGNDLAPLTTAPDGTPLASRSPAAHHSTPANTVMNALGKVIAQIVRNGASPADWHLTRMRYDHRGNLLEILDALGRPAFKHTYDLLNRPLRIDSIDAGQRTSVVDALGNLVEYRDSKGSVVLQRYDGSNRLVEVWAVDSSAAGQTLTLRERVIYGEQAGLADALDRHILGKPYLHYDEAGLLTLERYDFKGNLLEKSRRAVSDQALSGGWTAHWEDGVTAEAELDLAGKAYQTDTSFDALGRVTRITYPGDFQGIRAVLTPTYDRAGSLQSVKLDSDPYVRLISYNARGQRVLIAYGNGVMTRYLYDEQSFRLLRLRTEHFTSPAADVWQNSGPPIQDYNYSYDLAGNVVSIDEQVPGCGITQPSYSTGHVLDRNRLLREFEYDPLYRLISADGRACKSTSARALEDLLACGSTPANFNQANAPDLTEPYSETYRYDPAGNLLELVYHSGTGNQQNNWRRTFGMAGQTPSAWSQSSNNRLTRLEVGTNPLNIHTYDFDDNGSLKQRDADQQYEWDHADRLIVYRRQAQGAPAASVEAHYLYDASGMRIKKWVRTNGSPLSDESTVYIDNVFEHHLWIEAGNSRENNHLHIMDGQSRVAIVCVGPKPPGDGGEPVQYHLGDHLDSCGVVIGGTDAAASSFLNREEFFPYGETSFGSFGKKRYRFTGKERDEESGLNYHGMRYYLAGVCRWISTDPDINPSKTNLFMYARANPVRNLDPNGAEDKDANDKFSWEYYKRMFSPGAGAQISEGYDYYKKDLRAQQARWDKNAEQVGKVWDKRFDQGTIPEAGEGAPPDAYRSSFIEARIGKRPENIWWTLTKIYAPAAVGAAVGAGAKPGSVIYTGSRWRSLGIPMLTEVPAGLGSVAAEGNQFSITISEALTLSREIVDAFPLLRRLQAIFRSKNFIAAYGVLRDFLASERLELDIVEANTLGEGNLASITNRPGFLQIDVRALESDQVFARELGHEMGARYTSQYVRQLANIPSSDILQIPQVPGVTMAGGNTASLNHLVDEVVRTQ
jgi:RHS repeat-associated protein